MIVAGLKDMHRIQRLSGSETDFVAQTRDFRACTSGRAVRHHRYVKGGLKTPLFVVSILPSLPSHLQLYIPWTDMLNLTSSTDSPSRNDWKWLAVAKVKAVDV